MSAHAAVLSSTSHRFPWKWSLSDLDKVRKNGRKVFSCFSCGGGSSMGYKLAGFEVIGNCEIDPRMAAIYKANNHPKYTFNMDIRDFNKLEDLPEELKDLDILDGSPPCSVFSISSLKREEGWQKEKVFREGQKKQKLDDLFFHFIETVGRLKPKVFIAENVEGLTLGNAKGYVREIINGFDSVGYTTQIFMLDASVMGVPQKRCRVFFIGHQKEMDLPKLELRFSEDPVLFGEVRTETGKPATGILKEMLDRRKPSDIDVGVITTRERGRRSMFNTNIVRDDRVANTNTAGQRQARMCDGMIYSDLDVIHTQTFPEDYNFAGQPIEYVCGMSVPPVMMAQIATEINRQWFGGGENV